MRLKIILFSLLIASLTQIGCAGFNLSPTTSYKSEYELEQERLAEQRQSLRPSYIEIAEREVPERLKNVWAGREIEGFDFGEPMKLELASYHRLEVSDYSNDTAKMPVDFSQNGKVKEQEIVLIFNEDRTSIDRIEEIGQSTQYSTPKIVFFTKDPLAKFRKNKRLLKAIKDQKIYIGMPEEAMLLSWGRPSSTNSSVGSWGSRNQHVYGSRSYVYTRNGKVSSWQN